MFVVVFLIGEKVLGCFCSRVWSGGLWSWRLIGIEGLVVLERFGLRVKRLLGVLVMVEVVSNGNKFVNNLRKKEL